MFDEVLFSPDDENLGGSEETTENPLPPSEHSDDNPNKKHSASPDAYVRKGIAKGNQQWVRSLEKRASAIGVDLVLDEHGEVDRDATLDAIADAFQKLRPKTQAAEDETTRIVRLANEKAADAERKLQQYKIETEIRKHIPASVFDPEDVEGFLEKQYRFEVHDGDVRLYTRQGDGRTRARNEDTGEFLTVESAIALLLSKKQYLVRADQRGSVKPQTDKTGNLTGKMSTDEISRKADEVLFSLTNGKLGRKPA